MIIAPHHAAPRPRATTLLGVGAMVALLAGSAMDPLWSSSSPGVAPRPAAVAAPAHAWSPAQVRELIGLIEDARARGLAPDRYGLAALRSELELTEILWEKPGSRQLDALARASALALAADLRGLDRSGPAASLGRSLDRALQGGSLRTWLFDTRISARQGPVRPAAL